VVYTASSHLEDYLKPSMFMLGFYNQVGEEEATLY